MPESKKRYMDSNLVKDNVHTTKDYYVQLRSDHDGLFLALLNRRTGCVEGEGVNEILVIQAMRDQQEVLNQLLGNTSDMDIPHDGDRYN